MRLSKAQRKFLLSLEPVPRGAYLPWSECFKSEFRTAKSLAARGLCQLEEDKVSQHGVFFCRLTVEGLAVLGVG